jgi:hypothetical protein
MNTLVRRCGTVVGSGLLTVALSTAITGTAFANPTGNAGQPNQSCEDQPIKPGHASTAQGSPFNPDGVAGTKYAGEQDQNDNNPKSVSQYDVACFQVSSP